MYINNIPCNAIIEVSSPPPDNFNRSYRIFKSDYKEDREDFIINMSWEEFKVIENVVKEKIQKEKLDKLFLNTLTLSED